MLTVTKYAKGLVCALAVHAWVLLEAADILQGDSTHEQQSFVNPLQCYAMGGQGRFYVGAAQAGAKDFALARALPVNKQILSRAPEKVILDAVAGVANPLYDARIDLMAVMYGTEARDMPVDRLAVVKHARPATVYLIEDTGHLQHLETLSSPVLKDASGSEQAAGIVSLASQSSMFVFAAVTDHANVPFGQGNSGVAGAWMYPQPSFQPAPVAPMLLIQLDAQPGATANKELTRAATSTPPVRLSWWTTRRWISSTMPLICTGTRIFKNALPCAQCSRTC